MKDAYFMLNEKKNLVQTEHQCPIDLLPITRPLETSEEPSQTFFYENVVSKLVPDIVRLEANGIPIDLSKVAAVEETVDTVLENVYTKLENNTLMLKFLTSENTAKVKAKSQELESKKKSVSDYLVPFNPKNKTHRSYVVNTYLSSIGQTDMCMDEWSVKDLKKLNQILASNFIANLASNNIQSFMHNIIETAMEQMATDKANAYNKNKIDAKIEDLKTNKLVRNFNPGSSLQKQKFFSFLGIESEKETKAGNPQWDKKELERLQKLIGMLIDDKEHQYSQTDVSD